MAVGLQPDEAVAGQLRGSWFAQLYEISDIELQRRAWLDPTNRNPHWSFIEFVGSYPDDDQLLYAREHNWLTEEEFRILNEFRRILRSYSPPGNSFYDNAAVLADPGWQSVVEAAQRARQKLLSMTTDHHEQQMLLGIK